MSKILCILDVVVVGQKWKSAWIKQMIGVGYLIPKDFGFWWGLKGWIEYLNCNAVLDLFDFPIHLFKNQ